MADSRNTIDFECPRCLTRVLADSNDSGKRVDCPNCQLSLLVPSQSISVDLFEDIFDSLPLEQKRDSDRETVKEPEDAEFAKPGPSEQKSGSETAEPKTKSSPADKQPSSKSKQQTSPVAKRPPVSKSSAPVQASDGSPAPASDTDDATATPSAPVLSDDDPMAGFDVPAAEENLASPQPTDPFEIDKHAPLKLDDFHQEFAMDDIWGIKCSVCDTRIHVNKNQIGTDIECPICYSIVRVTPLEKNPKSEQRWLQSKPVKSKIVDEDEFKLSTPVERPKLDLPVDPSFGLEPVTDDLLSPKTKPDSAEPLEDVDLLGDSNREQSTSHPPTKPAPPQRSSSKQPTKAKSAPQKSRRELYEEARRRKGHIQRSGQEAELIKPKFEKPKSRPNRDADPIDDEVDQQIPELSLGMLASSVVQMLGSPGIPWRAGLATLLIGIGSAIMHPINNAWDELTKAGTATMTDWLSSFGAWMLFGGVPYFVGSMLCWLVASYVFREAAHGFRKVRKLRSEASSELGSTFLLFSFSFLIAGLPVAFFPILTTPFRFLVAPPLLLAAWFNKSPFAIVAVDAFQSTVAESGQWRAFYGFNICLVVLAIIGSLLMTVPTFILSAFCSLAGATIIVVTTIAFAAAAGWHCGRVVQRLENNA